MAIYTYKAINARGAILQGTIEAETQSGAVALLLQRGLTPTVVEDIKKLSKTGLRGWRRSPSGEDILFFIRNFSIAIQAGITVSAALEIMEKDATHPAMRDMMMKVGASVRGGTPLSQAFVPFSRYFTPAFIGLLRAGEISGSLGKAFALIGEYLKREFSLKQKLRSAMIYPVVLVAASVGVVILLMVFVLPKLSAAFAQSGTALPLITRIVLAISSVLTYSIILDLILLGLLIAGIIYLKNTKKGQELFHKCLEHAPIAKKMMRSVALVRFLRTLGNLLASGISMMEALHTTAESVGHTGIRLATLDTATSLEGGGQLSASLGKYPEYFPGVVVGLVRVGEETGKLGEILVEISEFYDDELDYSLRNMMALLEPMLLLGMGIAVGAIAISVLLPIYQLISRLA